MRGSRARVDRGEPELVLWRDGVHVAGTPIWCDARRARDVCFASRYEAVPAARHGQLIATVETFALYGGGAAGAILSSPCGRPFTLGTVRLELIRAGAGIGAASLAVDVEGGKVVYAGVAGRGEGLGGPADLRACDVLVMGCDHPDEAVRFPPIGEAAAWIAERWEDARQDGGALIVLVGSALDGLDLLAALAPIAGRALAAQSGIRAAVDRARAAAAIGEVVPLVRRATARVAAGELIVWPARRVAGLSRLVLPAGSVRVLVAGIAAEPGEAERVGAAAGLAWSLEADAVAAMEYAGASGARRIFVTGRAGPALAARLDGDGRSARALGPPEQMSLF